VNTNYKMYVKQILKYPLLTAEEEQELSSKIQYGDMEAKKELIAKNLRLVVSIAHRYSDSSIGVMDLIQEGNIGLMTAASKYHYSFNTRFSTYAYAWITQSMLRYIQRKSPLICVPVRKEEIIHKIETGKVELFHKLNREPTISEIANYTGIPAKTIKISQEYVFSVASMDAEIEPGSGQTLCDVLPDDKSSPENEILKEYERTQIQNLIDTLPYSEKTVIENRYCIVSQERKTLRQIGEMLGLSAETVRQKEKRALRKMRSTVNSNRELFSIEY